MTGLNARPGLHLSARYDVGSVLHECFKCAIYREVIVTKIDVEFSLIPISLTAPTSPTSSLIIYSPASNHGHGACVTRRPQPEVVDSAENIGINMIG